MAGKRSDFHMEWTDVRNTSSTFIFDLRGGFPSYPSGLCVMETSTLQISAVPFYSNGTFSSLNGVVAKDHGLYVFFPAFKVLKSPNALTSEIKVCFVRGC